MKGKITLPKDINSKEQWVEEAIKLIENSKYSFATKFLTQASYLSPIENETGFFHNDAKIWYYFGLAMFKEMNRIDEAMVILNKAISLNSNYKIPDDIKAFYEKYQANRNGEGVYIFGVNINDTGLRNLIPSQDMILVSAKVKITYVALDPNKKTTYTWFSPVLLSDNGIAYKGSTLSNESAYYVPWVQVVILKSNFLERNFGILMDNSKSLKFTFNCDVRIKNPEEGFKYIDYFIPIIEERKKERQEMILNNIKSLETIPSYKEYLNQFEFVSKPIFKKVLKELGKESKRV